jgi:hypothetical protein
MATFSKECQHIALRLAKKGQYELSKVSLKGGIKAIAKQLCLV